MKYPNVEKHERAVKDAERLQTWLASEYNKANSWEEFALSAASTHGINVDKRGNLYKLHYLAMNNNNRMPRSYLLIYIGLVLTALCSCILLFCFSHFVFGVMMIFGIAATIIGCITHAGRVIDNIEKIHKVIEYPTCAYSFTRYTM